MTRRKRNALITGIGVVSPIGVGKDAFWTSLLETKTGMRTIERFDVSSFPAKIAAQVTDFHPGDFLSERQQKYFSRGTQMALSSLRMALADALLTAIDPGRTDVIIGAAISSFEEIESQLYGSPSELREFQKGVVNPTGMIRAFINAPAAAIALETGARGYVTTVSSACTSALNAVGTAASRIKDGHADLVITGGVETPITRIILNAYCAANFLTDSEDPANALCPFDRRHTRSALGEGAVVFIVEEERHAAARSAPVYAEITNFAQTTENINELFMMDRTGSAWADVMRHALAGIVPDCVNAHGPSDLNIDRTEALALGQVLGKRLSRTPVFSIKGSIGSGMASAGAMQIAAGALSIKHSTLPPIYNYLEPDQDCGINGVAKPLRMDVASQLVNAHGVGGMDASLVLSRYAI